MATLKDIARETGVSMMTVSRALNSPEMVSDSLRATILEVSEKMSYMPHHGARSLASKKTGIVQIITGLQTTDYYFLTLLAGISDYLSENQYATMIEHQYKTIFKCDGVIVMSLESDESKLFLKNLGVPCVLFGKENEVDCVDINNINGIRQSVEYLVKLGHKKIMFLGVDSKERFAQERLQGFVRTMKGLNLDVNDNQILFCENTKEAAERTIRKVLKDRDVTGIVCATDVLAMAILNVARDERLRVPEDISIIGFDGVYIHDITVPKLTTMVQPVYQVGRKLAETMLMRINCPEMEYVHEIVETSLFIGGTVKELV